MTKSEHVWSAVTGLTLAVLLFLASAQGIQLWKEYTPASHWLKVNQIFVADAEVGEDPVVTYQREILRDANMDFTVTLSKHEDPLDPVGVIVCAGEGVGNLVAGRELPPAGTSLAWLMNREADPCKLSPGIYRARAVWNFYPDGYPRKQLTVDSNYFTIRPPKSAE